MRSSLSPRLQPPLGSAPRPRGEGLLAALGQRLQSRAPDAPSARGRGSGESRPRRGARPPARARCTSFPKRRRDRALQGSHPFLRVPAGRSRDSALLARPPGKPRKAEGTWLASAVAPHWSCRALGALTAAERRPIAASAPAPPARSPLGSPRGRPLAPARPRRGPRAAEPRAPLCPGLAKPARVNVNFANQALPAACASSPSAPSLSSSPTHGPPRSALPRNASRQNAKGGERRALPPPPPQSRQGCKEGPPRAVKKGVPRESGVWEAPGRASSALSLQGPAFSGAGGCGGGDGGTPHASLSRAKGFLDARKSPVAFAANAAGISRAIALLLRNFIF